MSGSVPPQSTPLANVLLVEDDPAIAWTIKDMLEAEGYAVRTAETGAKAKVSLDDPVPDLIILDLMLPDVDGLVLCADLKSRVAAPVIICSATIRKRDAVLALKLGADDFVAKPFDVDEFLTRVAAVLRRARAGMIARPADAAALTGVAAMAGSASTEQGAQATASVAPASASVTVGPLTLEHARRRVVFGVDEVQLTPTEYRLLSTFMLRPDEVLTRQELAQVVWGYEDASIGRSIDVHVHRLRTKLQQAQEQSGVPGPTIVSVRGFGYKLLRDISETAAA